MSPAIDTARAEVCNAAMKRVTAFAVLLVVLAAPAWAGVDEGWAALERGDYATALREFRVSAAQGVADAQHNLGVMYEKGQAPSRVEEGRGGGRLPVAMASAFSVSTASSVAAQRPECS